MQVLIKTFLTMQYVITPAKTTSVPVLENAARFPVHRIYCVGRNYEAHAREMGGTGREDPFFFQKPADAIIAVDANQTAAMPYPSLTQNLHHEVELVIAIGKEGRDIEVAQAASHIFGYAVGIDMTRRDLQNDMKKRGLPWCISKAFDHSAPIGSITPAAEFAAHNAQAEIWLKVNGQDRQRSQLSELTWNVYEIIAHLSKAWTLQPGDLIFTGTPEGVGAVVRGDIMEAGIAGLSPVRIEIK